jgi:fructoselysine transporter
MTEPENPKLIRGLSLWQATAINMLDMVGIGPFVVISSVVAAMNGPQCILAWIFGALLAIMDGTVWAELGAAMPEAGGSYVFLNQLYGPRKWGSLFSFLFIWQTTIQAPLVIASGSLGFAAYLNYFYPAVTLASFKYFDFTTNNLVAAGLVILLGMVLYRKITSIGKISVFLWVIVAGTILWIIFGGLTHFHSDLVFKLPEHAIEFSPVFFAGLGLASVNTIYSYLGYYNVCHLGGEIKNPAKNIPRSIFISIGGIAILYLLMQISILGVVPWQKILELKKLQHSDYVVSVFMEQLYGKAAAQIATLLILVVAASSLFSAILGYSRIPYAAARDGKFLAVFAKVHPTKHFPHASQLILCATAFVFSLLFKLRDVIAAIIFMRILVQFVGQAVGLILYRARNKGVNRPFKMWLFPVPALLSIAGWLFIFFRPLILETSDPDQNLKDKEYILGALIIIALGAVVFLFRARTRKEWPFLI